MSQYLSANVVSKGRRYAADSVITIVDRSDFKKWTVVGDTAWRQVELGDQGWSCNCSSPMTLCSHVVACGLAWMVHHKVATSVEDIDDKALLEAVRLLQPRKEFG